MFESSLSSSMLDKFRICVLLSGSGSTLDNLAARIESKEFSVDVEKSGRVMKVDAEIALVISSRLDATGLQKARDRNLRTKVVESKKFRNKDTKEIDWDGMGRALDQVLLPMNPDLILLAGFMCLYRFTKLFEKKILNIHPSLLPDFGGKGMFGSHVHTAVLAKGVDCTGCTVHFVSSEYDEGEIVLQKKCPVLPNDTVKSLQTRVQTLEREAFPEAVKQIMLAHFARQGWKRRVTALKIEQGA